MVKPDLRKLTKRKGSCETWWSPLESLYKGYSEARDKGSVPARLNKLVEVYDSFCDVRAEIEINLEQYDEQEEDSKELSEEARKQKAAKEKEQKYFSLKQSLEAFMQGPGSSIQQFPVQHANGQTPMPAMRVKLPELKLPTFRGSLMDWVTFRDTFKNLIVDNPHLNDIDRFTYLRTSLAGEALQQIASIDITAANYSVAWRTLESRYEK
ncbi:uncharacterized protein LOC134209597 [Armigeres subalbatus]|uniref:uncharacterized protein LOC134209597 n=1 Tax=Armigeres subalbatus TaxID=124917 RepID=UPI002ED41D56